MKQVYVLEGENLPPKLAVVAFELEHDTLLEITNRFLQGPRYTTLRPVHLGVFRIGDPIYGKDDQAYFPGWDRIMRTTDGGNDTVPTDKEPGRIKESAEAVPFGRVAYFVEYAKDGVNENWAIVVADRGGEYAELVAETLSRLPGKVNMTISRIGSGTFNLAPEIVQRGFSVTLAPSVTLEAA